MSHYILSPDIVDEMVVDLLSSFDHTPRVLALLMIYESGQHDQLLELPIVHPLNENDYQATKLLSKFTQLNTTYDLKERALASFFEFESSCKIFNESLIANTLPEKAFILIESVKRKIEYMLKGFNPLDFLDLCSFGPGSDDATQSFYTSCYNKLENDGGCTREASMFLDFISKNSALTRMSEWDDTHPPFQYNLALGNKVTTVPKNSKTDRLIAVEPRWNIFLQKGMGSLLKKVLYRQGINLSRRSDGGIVQSELNGMLAKAGSIDNSLATIDLRGASDTISYQLVKAVFPPLWFEIFRRLRSSVSFVNGAEVRLEKFSSMGNGFTFELETLLFLAIVRTTDREAVCFGDDIICRTDAAEEIICSLNHLGFHVNKDKSYYHYENFRESCGQDYLNGKLITPFYLKELKNDRHVLSLANGISALATRSGSGFYRDLRFRATWKRAIRHLPRSRQHYGPLELSGSIHHDYHSYPKGRVRNPTWDGTTFRTIITVPRLFRFRKLGAAALAALLQPSTDGYNIRGVVVERSSNVFLSRGYTSPPPWGCPLTMV